MYGAKVESVDHFTVQQISETDVVIDPDLEDQTLSEMKNEGDSQSEHPDLIQARAISGGESLECRCPPCISSSVFVVIMLCVVAAVRSLRA